MKKNRLNVFAGIVVTCLVAPMCMAGSYFTNVASHATPMLVKEVNVALNNLEDRMDGTAAQTSVAKTESTVTNYNTVTHQTLTASNKVDDAATWIVNYRASTDKTGTFDYVTEEYITEDVSSGSIDGGYRLRLKIGNVSKYIMCANSNSNTKLTLGPVVKFDKPFEVVAGSISNAAYATASVDATKLAAGSVGGSEYIAGSISNVAIAAGAAIAASKLGFDPCISKDAGDRWEWTQDFTTTAAGTSTVQTLSYKPATTNWLWFSQPFYLDAGLPTGYTNGYISNYNTNTFIFTGYGSERVRIRISGKAP